MKDIQYQIEFFSNWHCGSGLAAGADVDALVVKDVNGLPYVPGRTVKGLLRHAAEELTAYVKDSDAWPVAEMFGRPSGSDASAPTEEGRTSAAFFGNATLAEGPEIVQSGLTEYLYQTFASTAIDDDGIAKDHSLRKTETVVPCVLQGQIRNVPEDGLKLLEAAMQMVKRMGTGRTRGYGRCKMSIIETEEAR